MAAVTQDELNAVRLQFEQQMVIVRQRVDGLQATASTSTDGPWKAEVQRLLLEQKTLQEATMKELRDLYSNCHTSLTDINTWRQSLPASTPHAGGKGRDKEGLVQVKDMVPTVFTSKDEGMWTKWKEEVHDYICRQVDVC